MEKVSRRDLATAMAAAAATLPLAATAAANTARPRNFPRGFRWGCATAAYQIEGAVQEDGRGQSIWDVFAHTPGKIVDGSNGDAACDSYHRYGEDAQLLKNLGANAYRFSIAWSRIFPDGRGQPNPKGVDHYQRVVDNLLENGIEPHVTLFHWDLPAALAGGWQSRDTAAAFADYAGYMAAQLCDRVRHFMTLNELSSFTDLGHRIGIHAPGLRLALGEVNQVRHHALLAHGLGVQAIRAAARRNTLIGIADNPSAVVPVIETPEHIEAARKAMRRLNAPFLPAILDGAYQPDYLADEGANAPRILAGDMNAIGSPLDFVGLNVYGPVFVQASARPSGFEMVRGGNAYPTMVLPWLAVGPESIYWAVRLVSELWKPKSIYLTENGCAAKDVLANGHVGDVERVMYLRNYLSYLQRAAADGYPVKGYFLWSLMDNFEWGEGYSARFGIHYTKFDTQTRIPKLSAQWYKELIARNAMV
jgi:beta-glucosidase